MSDRLSEIREKIGKAAQKNWGASYPFPMDDIRYLLSIAEAAEAYREAEAAYVAASQTDDDPHKELTAYQYAESRLFAALDGATLTQNEGEGNAD